MSAVPLLGPYDHDDVLAWQEGRAVTCGQFLAQVEILSSLLPERPAVINLTENRYGFLTGFAAALIRGQTTLLPPGRSPQALSQIARLYPDSYCLSDGAAGTPGLPFFSLPHLHESTPVRMPIPIIPAAQTAAVVFTSGSTGQPRFNVKTWSSLTTVARHTAVRLGLSAGEKYQHRGHGAALAYVRSRNLDHATHPTWLGLACRPPLVRGGRALDSGASSTTACTSHHALAHAGLYWLGTEVSGIGAGSVGDGAAIDGHGA